MDASLGLVGKDYVLLAADGTAGRSIMVYQTTEDKIVELTSTKAMAIAGPQGDRSHFGEYIQKNLVLYELRNELCMSSNALANYVRTELANALRSSPYEVHILLGAVDNKGPSLFYLDYLGSMTKVNFGSHGHASNFVFSVFDRYWKPDMDVEQGKEVMRKCIHELQTRFIISYPKWKFKLITKDGTQEISLFDEEAESSASVDESSVALSSEEESMTASSSSK